MQPADEAGDERHEGEQPDGRLEDREGEPCHAKVDEDVALGHLRDGGEGLRGEGGGLRAEASARVLRHKEATEEDRHDARELERGGGVVGDPREDEGERCLCEHRRIVLVPRPPVQLQVAEGEGGAQAAHESNDHRTDKDVAESHPRVRHARTRELDARLHALSEDHGEEVGLHAQRLEDSEHRHRVGRRDEAAKGERGQPRERVAQPELACAVDDAADGRGRAEGADEGEKARGAQVGEERAHLHVVPRLEDDRRQQVVGEDIKVEALAVKHGVVVQVRGRGRAERTDEHTHSRLRQDVDVVAFEQVADDEGGSHSQDAEHTRPLDGNLRLGCTQRRRKWWVRRWRRPWVRRRWCHVHARPAHGSSSVALAGACLPSAGRAQRSLEGS
eukprot:scaffold1319_cov64-Phaeocystis_antarctica.AAC.3